MNDHSKEILDIRIKHITRGAWFSILNFDQVMSDLGRVAHPKSERYKLLKSVHCIHWDQMSQELKDDVHEAVRGIIQSAMEANEAKAEACDKPWWKRIFG